MKANSATRFISVNITLADWLGTAAPCLLLTSFTCRRIKCNGFSSVKLRVKSVNCHQLALLVQTCNRKNTGPEFPAERFEGAAQLQKQLKRASVPSHLRAPVQPAQLMIGPSRLPARDRRFPALPRRDPLTRSA